MENEFLAYDEDKQSTPKETLVLRGSRSSTMQLLIGDSEHTPARDAAMLEVVLETTLDPATWTVFVQRLFKRYFEEAMQTMPPKRKTKRPRKKPLVLDESES